MKSVLHGVATFLVVVVTALCVLVQVDQLDTAVDTIQGRPASATK